MSKSYYPAIFHPEDTGYSVQVPDIDGCFSQGDTLEEAMEMINDAIGLCIQCSGGEIPKASHPTAIHPADPKDFVALVPFDMFAYRRKHETRAVKKTLSIPCWLNEAAQQQHINFSSVLQSALKEQLGIE